MTKRTRDKAEAAAMSLINTYADIALSKNIKNADEFLVALGTTLSKLQDFVFDCEVRRITGGPVWAETDALNASLTHPDVTR